MQPPHLLGHGRRCHGPYHRLRKGAVECEIDFRDPRRRGEPAFVGRIVTAEGADVVQGTRLATHHPIARNEIGADGIPALRLEHGLVQAGREDVDQVDVAGKFAMLLARDSAGNEYSQMADGFVDRVDDGLSVGTDFIDVVIQIENPSERLLGRRDVVPFRTEHDDGRANVAQIDGRAIRCLDFTGGKFVADEQVVDNGSGFPRRSD